MKSKIVESILKKTSLETRLKVYLQMNDYINWNNGEYSGNINEELESLLKYVEEWQKDEAPLRNKKIINNTK